MLGGRRGENSLHIRLWDGRGVVEGRGRFIVEQPLTFGETPLEIAHLLFHAPAPLARLLSYMTLARAIWGYIKMLLCNVCCVGIICSNDKLLA